MKHPRPGKSLLITLFLLLLSANHLAAEEDLVVPAAEAKDHIGSLAMVCGVVVDTHYAQTSTGRPTYINFEEPYPNALFTAVIWEQGSENFNDAVIRKNQGTAHAEYPAGNGRSRTRVQWRKKLNCFCCRDSIPTSIQPGPPMTR